MEVAGLPELNWVAVGAAAFTAYIVGGLWFSPLGFMNTYVKAVEKNGAKLPKPHFLRMAGGALLVLTHTTMLALLFEVAKDIPVPPALAFLKCSCACWPPAAVVAGVCFVSLFNAAASFNCVIWEGRPLSYWLILVGAGFSQWFASVLTYTWVRHHF
eukprot:Lankesteria_metandrocarpae@DN5336_c1_g2_i12.p1